jgi:hypothetical protein
MGGVEAANLEARSTSRLPHDPLPLALRPQENRVDEYWTFERLSIRRNRHVQASGDLGPLRWFEAVHIVHALSGRMLAMDVGDYDTIMAVRCSVAACRTLVW